MIRIYIIAVLFATFHFNARSQNDSVNYRLRKTVFIGSASSLYAVSLYALGKTWYSKYEHSSFHWFNDNSEWLQMDKCGHAVTAWKLSTVLYKGFEYSGYSKRKSAVLSVIATNVAMGSIEFFDGFSAKWGASYGDLIANFSGSAIFTSQNLWLKKPWLIPKFSFHRSGFETNYPELFGNSLPENTLKDYNGQTYWLAIPLKRFHTGLPEWLCISAGYGANDMTSGKPSDADGYKRYRQYYLSFDINLTGIKTRSTFLRTCFNTFNIVRIPLPALELSNGKLKGHAIYF